MNKPPFGLGAPIHSRKDKRLVKDKHLAQATPYPVSYETDVSPLDILGTDNRYQKNIGVCVAAAVTTYVEWLYWKKTGKLTRLSVAFCYIVTKLYMDKNMNEGTSLRSCIDEVMKFGICTEATFPTNYDLTNQQMLLQTIPQAAWTEALDYCIGGFISIPVDKSLMAAAIYKYGLLLKRMECGDTWWVPSWAISLVALVKPSVVVSGHAVDDYKYDLTTKSYFWFLNWWSKAWGVFGGAGYSDVDSYAPTEAWVLTLDSQMHLVDNSAIITSSTFSKFMDLLRKIW